VAESWCPEDVTTLFAALLEDVSDGDVDDVDDVPFAHEDQWVKWTQTRMESAP
jgi:hypothetical protein